MDRSWSFAPELAKVVECLGTARFSRALHKFLRSNVSASLVFAYAIRPDDGEAIHLLTQTLSARVRRKAKDAARTYAREDFRTDTNLGELGEGINVRLHHAADIKEPLFRERYFENLEISEEISMVECEGSEILYVGVSSSHFTRNERDYMKEVAPLILALTRKHRELIEASVATAERPRDFDQMHAMLMDHPGQLTGREAQICVMVARGFSTEAIGLNLSISPHTVATHRKNAYAKLRVSTKGELFAMIYVPRSRPHGAVG